MATGKFKCPKCDRSFSMAAHLARHANTIHATGRGRKRTGRPGKKRKVARLGRPPGRPAGSRRLAAKDGALRLLDGMRAYQGKLVAQRANLDLQIEGIEAAIGAMGGSASRMTGVRRRRKATGAKRKRAGAGRRGRPPAAKAGRPASRGARPGPLRERIVRVLRQRSNPMSPREIASAVRASGYKSKAKNLTKAVSNTLPKITAVKKVGRGMYRA